MRLLPFLKVKCSEAPSVKGIKRAIDSKCCTVNGRIETFSSHTLMENDLVALSPDAFTQEEKKSVMVLFEDEQLLIFSKPSGISSEQAALKPLFPKWTAEWGLVHRLDKETTGVLIIAKTSEAKKRMLEEFKQRRVHKAYLAIVDGIVKKEEGKIDNYLGRLHSYQGQVVYGEVDPKKGDHAITFWKCLRREKDYSVVWCEPHTGRTHQLRVHLSEMGHPILGDVQYGKRFRSKARPKRNLLHAYQIRFTHPFTGKELKATAPIPEDFQSFVRD